MRDWGHQLGDAVAGFQGENRRVVDLLLPVNVSPDALNCDYSDGTIKKRQGMHSEVWFDESGTNGSMIWCGVYPHVENEVYNAIAVSYYFAGTAFKFWKYIWDNNAWSAMETHVVSTGGARPKLIPVMVNGTLCLFSDVGEHFRIKADTDDVYYLVHKEVDCTGVVVASGAGTGLTGVRKYLFAYLSSYDGTETPFDMDTQPVASPAVANQDILIQYIPFNDASQIDKVRIYATHMDGDVYYFHSDVNNVDAGGGVLATVTDTTQDAALVTEVNLYRGKAPIGAKGACVWDDRLWVVYDDGLLYSEKDAGDGMPLWSAFYEWNYVSFVGEHTDDATGVCPVDENRCLVFREASVWMLSNLGGYYKLERFSSATGCIAQETIAKSDRYVYWLANGGVWGLSLPYNGTPPVELSGTQRDWFSPSVNWQDIWAPSAIYVPWLRQYRLYFAGDGPLVFFEDISTPDRPVWGLWRQGVPPDSDYLDYDGPRFPFRVIPEDQKTVCLVSETTLFRQDFGSRGDCDVAGETGTVGHVHTIDSRFTTIDAGAGMVQRMVGCRILFKRGTTYWWGLVSAYIDAASVTVDMRNGAAPQAGDQFWIGGIDWYWNSPAFSPPGNPTVQCQTEELFVWRDTGDGIVLVEGFWEGAADSGVETELPGSQHQNFLLFPSRGRLLKIKFSNPTDNDIELHAWQLRHEEAEPQGHQSPYA